MKFTIVESGSKGNATIVSHRGCVLLIDMAVSLTALKQAMNVEKKNLLNIDALLLTHSHSDHTKSISLLPPLPIYCTEGTYDNSQVEKIEKFQQFSVKCFRITPISTSHDAPNSVGFIIEDELEKLVYLTDSGYIPDETLKLIGNADYYIFESNHDVKMLLQTNRPECLKQRILSDHGHLCNEDSAFYMADLVGENTKEIVLAHLSEEANSPEKALAAYKKIFHKRKIKLDNIKLHCANQHTPVKGGNENEL